MGHLIEETALRRGHEIAAVIDVNNTDDFNSEAFRSADVAIEFSTPATGAQNIRRCFEAGVPVVSGTTGFAAELVNLREQCEKGEGTLLHSTNFSIGVNIFRALNRYLATLMSDFPDYLPYITETHHVHKLDHPSGTAIALAEEIVEAHKDIRGWYDPTASAEMPGMMPVSSVREWEVPGIHTIKWESDDDTITISHSAKSRRGFASGAVRAAEWLAGRNGFFTLGEMLADITHTHNLFT